MKTNDLLSKIQSTNTISESEINLLKRRMNNGEKIDLDYIWNNEILLTEDQNKKGIDFLKNLWKTPRGIERKNNPFGYREERTLETFTHFEFRGFYDASRYGQIAWYIPIYVCCGNEGSFEYYYNQSVQIIG